MCIMDSSNGKKIIEEYMPRLEDLIMIEERIISPRTLSHLLHIDVLSSRLLIEEFRKKYSDEVYAFYLLQGKRKGEPEFFGINTCSQDKLDEAKQLFMSEPHTSIASIQKIGTDTSLDSRTAAELEFLTTSIDLMPIKSSGIDLSKKRIFQISESAVPPVSSKVSKVNEKSNEKTKKNDAEVKKEFSKDNSVPTKSVSADSSKKQSSAKLIKGNSIGNFFGKQAASSSKKPTEDKGTKSEESSKYEEKSDYHEESDAMEVDPTPEVPTEKCSSKTSKSSAKKNKPKNKKSSKANINSKKRKRIMTTSDSESEQDEDKDDYLEEEPLEEPPPQPMLVESDDEVIPPTPVSGKGRKRVQKQIDKTYEDADGFIITKKEYIYESCSDSNDGSPSKQQKSNGNTINKNQNMKSEDGEHSVAKQSVENSPKKSPVILAEVKGKGKGKHKESPQKGSKQTSLMNFFKKK